MSEEQLRSLERQLWNISDILRGKMNADEYKNYILGFIFYKYLSEKQELYAKEFFEDPRFDYLSLIGDENAIESLAEDSLEGQGFFLRPEETFHYIVKKGKGEMGDDKFILEDLKKAMKSIEDRASQYDSGEDFIGLFEDVDLSSQKLGKTPNEKNDLIVGIFSQLNEINFDISNPKGDILGAAYEYLIGQFAAGAGKKGGEFYTPAQVSRILARIVALGKSEIDSVYDPTCGSGSLLIRIGDYVKKVRGYYGQELNRTTYNLARMNMLLHGIEYDRFTIRQGDTLENDRFAGMEFETIVANPPFSAKWKGKESPILKNDERFAPYGDLAPKSYADYAFVTHMIHHLREDGTMAVVLPHGVLFRGGAEGKIRRAIIEKFNYLDAVIGLADNLFYGTGIPACILVFKKCRERDDVLFVDASKLFEKGKNQNRLTDEHVDKIVEAYQKREEIEKFSHVASLEEIRENDFNLNIPRYVDTFEEEEPIDLDGVVDELDEISKKEREINYRLARYCEDLGIRPPISIDDVIDQGL